MKLAIKKIEYILAKNARSWNHVGRNGSVPIDLFLSTAWSELDFTDLTANLKEDWQESKSGLFSQVTVTGTIRANQTSMRSVLTNLSITKNIFRVTTVAGEKMIVGSIEFSPRLTFKKVIEGFTAYEYQFTIICQSPQGLIYDTTI